MEVKQSRVKYKEEQGGRGNGNGRARSGSEEEEADDDNHDDDKWLRGRQDDTTKQIITVLTTPNPSPTNDKSTSAITSTLLIYLRSAQDSR